MQRAIALNRAISGGVMFLRRLAAGNVARTSVTPLRRLLCYPAYGLQENVTPCISHTRRLLQATRSLHSLQIVAAAESSIVQDELPEPGTPEAPPQVPPEFTHVPGTDTPVEQIVVSADSGVGEVSSQSNLSNAEEELIAEVTAATIVDPAGEMAASTPRAPEHEAFELQWSIHMAKLKETGIFTSVDEDGRAMTDVGAVKRANLELGRRRPEAIYELDSAKIKPFVAAYVAPTPASALGDRKCHNAVKRLKATYLVGSDLGVAEGGAATLLDVSRVLWALHCDLEHPDSASLLSPEFVMAGTSLLPDIISIMDRDPSPEALAKAAAAEREMQDSMEANKARRADKLADRRSSGGRFDQAPSYGAQNSNVKPGDWFCNECTQHNFARNQECFKCHSPRPADAAVGGMQPRYQRAFQEPSAFRPGDWSCPQCNAHNFANKEACFKCSFPRPEDAGMPSGASGYGSPYGGSSYSRRPANTDFAKPGDWTCLDCGASNFARRTDCFKCSAPRSADSPVVEGDEYAAPRGRASYGRSQDFSRGGPPGILRNGSPRESPQKRPGDWDCPDCNAHNFASKEACYRCGIVKPPGSEYMGEEYRARPSYSGSSGRGSSYGRTSNFNRTNDNAWYGGQEGAQSGREGRARNPQGERPAPSDLDW